MFPLPGELLSVAQQKGVAVGAGNERAAARAAARVRDPASLSAPAVMGVARHR